MHTMDTHVYSHSQTSTYTGSTQTHAHTLTHKLTKIHKSHILTTHTYNTYTHMCGQLCAHKMVKLGNYWIEGVLIYNKNIFPC